MKVLFITEGTPSTQSVVHRVSYAQESLIEEGIEAQVFYGTSGTLFGHRFHRATIRSAIKSLLALPKVDVLVIHRAADPLTAAIASLGKRVGVRILFDLDDAIYLRWNILSACVPYLVRNCDAVTAGSHTLARYCAGLNANVHLVPTQVDTRLFRPPASRGSNAVPIIGWMGDGRVHAENLRMLVEPLLKLAERIKFDLKLVSSLGNPQIIDGFRLLERYVHIDYGPKHWTHITEIPKLMADFDVSVMPLADTEFNRGKAGQKLLESMAMEIPVVASPVGENEHIVSHGRDGFLAATGQEWTAYLHALLVDPELRARIGGAGREKIEVEYSRRVVSRLFTRALKSALNRAPEECYPMPAN